MNLLQNLANELPPWTLKPPRSLKPKDILSRIAHSGGRIVGMWAASRGVGGWKAEARDRGNERGEQVCLELCAWLPDL